MVIGPGRAGADRERLRRTRRHADVDDVLLGDADERAELVGEEARQPRAAGEDERLGRPLAAVGLDDGQQPAAGGAARPHGRDLGATAGALERRDGLLHRVAREQHAGLRLPERLRDARGPDLRPAVLDLVGVEDLVRNAGRREHGRRAMLERAPVVAEPDHARLVVERRAPFLLEALPERPGLVRPARVEGVVAVRAAGDARRVAARCPRVAGAPRVEQRHAPAPAGAAVLARAAGLRPVRGPGAHHAGADDQQVRRRARSRSGQSADRRTVASARFATSGSSDVPIPGSVGGRIAPFSIVTEWGTTSRYQVRM